MKDLIFECNRNGCRLIEKHGLYTIIFEKHNEKIEVVKAQPLSYFLNKTFKSLLGGE